MWYSIIPSQHKLTQLKQFAHWQEENKPRKILFKIHNLTFSGDYFIFKHVWFKYIGEKWDSCYLSLPSKCQIFGKFEECCTASSGECPQILFHMFLHWC